MIRLGVLISGEGTNLQAILDAISGGTLDAEVRVVISNVASARGIERAKEANVPAVVVGHHEYRGREEFDQAMVDVLMAHGVEYVVLAGFMRILTNVMLSAFPMRILNIHPALLPAFPGMNAQAQAIQHGVRVAGCTVHFVDSGTDSGPILAQAVVPVLGEDNDALLRHRISEQEHLLYPKALQWIAEGRVTVVPARKEGDRPRVTVRGVQTALGVEQ